MSSPLNTTSDDLLQIDPDFLDVELISSPPLTLSASNLVNYNALTHHEQLSGMERWLQEEPTVIERCLYGELRPVGIARHIRDRAGGIERRGRQPPTPVLPPRLAAQQSSGSSGTMRDDGPRCRVCNARVCICQYTHQSTISKLTWARACPDSAHSTSHHRSL